MQTETLERWLTLTHDVEAWPGDPGSGRCLLDRIRNSEPPRGSLEGLAAELRRARRSLETGRADTKLDALGAPVLRLLALDDRCDWPWSDERACLRRLTASATHARRGDSEDDAGWRASRALARVAGVVAAVEGVAGDRARAWLWTAFALRPRELWVPHAVELSAVYDEVRDAARAPDLARLASAPEVAARRVSEDERHLRRHMRILATLVAARRGRFAGRDAHGWLATIEDFHDLSAVASAALELALAGASLAKEAREIASRAMEAVAKKHPRSVSHHLWDSARRLVELSAGAPPEVAWTLLLDDAPVYAMDETVGAAALFDAGRTLRWLDRFDAPIAQAARARLTHGRLATAPAIEPAARFEMGDWNDRLRRAVRMLAPPRWAASPRRARAAALAECGWLLLAPEARDLWWPDVCDDAGASWLVPTRGTVGFAGWHDLVRIAAGRESIFDDLLHRSELAPDADGGDGELVSLLRARWIRSEVPGGEVAWKVSDPLTRNLGDRIVRRLLASDGEEQQALLILRVLSEDAPPGDARRVVAGVAFERLWSHTRSWLPVAAPRVREALFALVEAESLVSASTPEWVAARSARLEAVAKALPTIAEPVGAANAAATAALATLASGPRPSGQGGAPIIGQESAVATPERVRAWAARVRALAGVLDGAAASFAKLLPSAGATRVALDARVFPRVEGASAPSVALPLVDPVDEAAWRDVIDHLRAIAAPLPVHVGVAIDAIAANVRGWLESGHENYQRRQALLRDLDDALRDGNEAAVDRIVRDDASLLGSATLRQVGLFWLNRLMFTKARALRKAGVPVPPPASHYAPLLLGIAGAPLSTLQADKIWAPLFRAVATKPLAPTYHVTVWSLLAVCVYMLWTDVRRSAGDLPSKTLALRGAAPFATLAALNYTINGFIVWIAPQSPEDDPARPLATLVLWAHLSLFIGVFLGLIAQGRRATQG